MDRSSIASPAFGAAPVVARGPSKQADAVIRRDTRGNIIHWATAEERFWAKVTKSDGCWERPIYKGDRYSRIRIGRKIVGAHRFSWELHNGPIPDGMDVLHDCDNPPCVRPDHLHLGTHADNMAEAGARGRKATVLSTGDVLAMRSLRANTGATYKAIACLYGVSYETARKAILRKTWKHVT